MPDTTTAPISRSYRAVAIDDVSRPRRTVTAKINTGIVDRYRTVVLPSGGDCRNFLGTPAVLWEHGLDPTRGRQAVGTCTSIKYRKAEDDILAVTAFKADEYSDRIFSDYLSGTLTSFSIDFIPDPAQSSRPSPSEARAHPDWADAECVYRKWELTGYSAVSYPGNPEALAVAVARGLWVPDEVRRDLPAVAPVRAMGEGSGAAGGYTTCQKEGRWCVMKGDNVVSVHDTEEDATQARLEAMDADGDDDGDEAVRTAPPTPAPAPEIPVIRSYTAEELAGLIGRAVFDPMFSLFDRKLRDAEDLAKGRV